MRPNGVARTRFLHSKPAAIDCVPQPQFPLRVVGGESTLAGMPKKSLAIRIYSDPAYTDVVRLVGYQGEAYPIAEEKIESLNRNHGAAKIAAAMAELVESDPAGTRAMLKPGVMRLCRGILGPSPEEWDEFYKGVENPPPNPYKDRAVSAEGPPHKTRRKNSRKPAHRPANSETESSSDVRNLEGVELMKQYFAAKQILEENAEESEAFCQAKPEYDRLKSECRRRDINLPPTGYDDPAFPFKKHTTHRLKELLDMSQYELTRYPPDSVTYEEAVRDIGFIETELRRRSQKTQSSAVAKR